MGKSPSKGTKPKAKPAKETNNLPKTSKFVTIRGKEAAALIKALDEDIMLKLVDTSSGGKPEVTFYFFI